MTNKARAAVEFAVKEYKESLTGESMSKMECYAVINCAYQVDGITYAEREKFLQIIGWGFYNG